MNALAEKAPRALAVMEIVLVAASLRVVITAVSPLVAEIRDDLGLSNAAIGLLTALPLIAFAAFSTTAVTIAGRLGTQRVIAGAMALVTAGVVLRSGGTVMAAFAGTALVGAGVAAGNVLLPVVVQHSFPTRGSSMSSLYITVMVGFGGLGAAISVPLATSADLGWSGALACSALPPALALAVCLLKVRRGEPRRPRGTPATVPLPWRSGLAWQVTLFMGTQSLVFYGLVAWFPELLRADGVSPSRAGAMLGMIQISSLVATVGVPVLAGQRPSQGGLVIASSVLCLAGFAGLLAAPGELALVWAILLGLGTGAWFSLALTLLILRSADARHTAALSGMAQSVGYAIAATGPVALGALHDATGGWMLPLLAFLAVTAVVSIFGLAAARDRFVGANASG